MSKLAVLNTSILTSNGTYRMKDITLEEARDIVRTSGEIDSAIGHQATADILTTLLGVDITMNRQMFEQQTGQKALVFKLNGRPEEGKILSVQEIEETGYSFKLLVKLDSDLHLWM